MLTCLPQVLTILVSGNKCLEIPLTREEEEEARPIFRYFMLDTSMIRLEIYLNGDKTCNDLPPPHEPCSELLPPSLIGIRYETCCSSLQELGRRIRIE